MRRFALACRSAFTLMSTKLQAQLKKDGREVALEYILAVPAARYGDFADDLSSLHEAQDNTQEWCGQTQWKNSRLVVAHDPVAAARRGAARDRAIAELIDIGQQCSVKLDAQDQSARMGKKSKARGRPMSDSGTKARFYHAVKDAHMAHVIQVDLKVEASWRPRCAGPGSCRHSRCPAWSSR